MQPHEISLQTRAKSADHGLYLLGASLDNELRHKVWLLSLLYKEINDLVNSTSEEMIGHIRLAWWREHIEALHNKENTISPSHPLLIDIVPIISDIPIQAWQSFFEYYSHILSNETDNSSKIITSPILSLIEAATSEGELLDEIKLLWSIGELAISKVTPELHYRYDIACLIHNSDDAKIIDDIMHQHETLNHEIKKNIKINKLGETCCYISNERIARLSRSKHIMHAPKMGYTSFLLPLKLWTISRNH